MLEASGAARSLSRALAGRHYGRLNLSASRKELTYREQQPEQRQHDEHDLMDVILARWQVAQEVRRPEDRVVAERVKGPAFAASERGHRDHDTEKAHADGRRTDGPQVCSARTRQNDHNQAISECRNANHQQRNPARPKPKVL